MNQNIAPQMQLNPVGQGPDPVLIKLAQRIRSGSGWIFAVAGLSAVNSIIVAIGLEFYFLVGLGVTQFIDAMGFFLAEEYVDMALIVKGIALILSLGVSGILALFGFFARRGHAWAFILVGLGYAVDALIVLYFEDFMGVIFHVLALFYIGSGTLAALKFKR